MKNEIVYVLSGLVKLLGSSAKHKRNSTKLTPDEYIKKLSSESRRPDISPVVFLCSQILMHNGEDKENFCKEILQKTNKVCKQLLDLLEKSDNKVKATNIIFPVSPPVSFIDALVICKDLNYGFFEKNIKFKEKETNLFKLTIDFNKGLDGELTKEELIRKVWEYVCRIVKLQTELLTGKKFNYHLRINALRLEQLFVFTYVESCDFLGINIAIIKKTINKFMNDLAKETDKSKPNSTKISNMYSDVNDSHEKIKAFQEALYSDDPSLKELLNNVFYSALKLKKNEKFTLNDDNKRVIFSQISLLAESCWKFRGLPADTNYWYFYDNVSKINALCKIHWKLGGAKVTITDSTKIPPKLIHAAICREKSPALKGRNLDISHSMPKLSEGAYKIKQENSNYQFKFYSAISFMLLSVFALCIATSGKLFFDFIHVSTSVIIMKATFFVCLLSAIAVTFYRSPIKSCNYCFAESAPVSHKAEASNTRTKVTVATV